MRLSAINLESYFGYSLCNIVSTDVVRVESGEDGANGEDVVVLVESRHLVRRLFWGVMSCVCELGEDVNGPRHAISICVSVVQTPTDFSFAVKSVKRAYFLRLSCRNRRDEVLRHSCGSLVWSLERASTGGVLDFMAWQSDSFACNMTL